MAERNLQIRLAARPVGLPKPSDFELVHGAVPEPGDGELVVRNVYLSLDPAMRGWMNDARSYVEPVALGDVMRGGTVGEVVASRRRRFPEGTLVRGMLGWQRYALTDGKGLSALPEMPPGTPLSASLGVLGMTGLTAYFGLLEIGRPQPGETVLVSAAAGAVGSVVGQIASLRGCRAVGIAGSDAKCDWITGELGFAAAVNYKTEPDLAAALRAACPNGVDVYFDNVGGPVLDAALRCINRRARVVVCGAISQYNATEATEGPRSYLALLVQRARMEGFIIFDYAHRYGEALAELAGWLAAGRLRHRETIVDGLDNAPRALLRLFEGRNVGKLLVRVGAEPH